MTRSRSAETVHRLKQLLIESSPLIEGYTRQVCPSCADVCCKQRHGLFTESDRAYLAALGEPVPPHDPSRPPDGSCQFLTGSGCAKPRWQRAWKCTWYFCEPLLKALAEGPQKEARALSAALEEMGWLYGTMSPAKHMDTEGADEDPDKCGYDPKGQNSFDDEGSVI